MAYIYNSPNTMIVSGVTLHSVGNFSFGAIDDYYFLPTSAEVLATSVDGALLGSAIGSIGTNSTSYNNVAAANILLGLNSPGKTYTVSTLGLGLNSILVSPDTEIFFRISTPLTLGEVEAVVLLHGHLLTVS